MSGLMSDDYRPRNSLVDREHFPRRRRSRPCPGMYRPAISRVAVSVRTATSACNCNIDGSRAQDRDENWTGDGRGRFVSVLFDELQLSCKYKRSGPRVVCVTGQVIRCWWSSGVEHDANLVAFSGQCVRSSFAKKS